MVLRVGNYDFLTYMNQMKKGSKLNGVGTMTLYTGPDKWKKPRKLREIVMLTKAMYEGNYKALIQDIVVLKESLIIAAIFTHTKITEEDLPEGDEVRMCVEMDRLFNRFKNEGRTEGIETGKLSTLETLLKVKLGSISRSLEEQLSNTSIEQLDELTVNIFNINSEEDVMKLLH